MPQFGGKVLYVKFSPDDRGTGYILEPRIEEEAGRLFLKGKPIYFDGAAEAKEQFCVAWDSVICYFVFDSIDHCNASRLRWRSARESKEKKSWWRNHKP